MLHFIKLIRAVWSYRRPTLLGILFHVFVAFFTVISIPLVVPFFQLLFGREEKAYDAPQSIWDVEGLLHYAFSSLLERMDELTALQWVCGLVLLVFLLKNLCRFLISYFMVPVRNGLLRDMRVAIWRSYQTMSLKDRDQLQQGYLYSLITNDLAEVDHGILKTFELLFKLPLIIVGSFIFMLLLNPLLTAIAFALILFTLFVVGKVSHSLKAPSNQAQDSLAKISTLVDQYLSSLKSVRSLGLEYFYKQSFDRENQQYYHSTNTILLKRDLASPLAEFLGVATVIVLLYIGTLMVLQDKMEPSIFFAFIFAFYNIIDPAKSFSREYSNVQRGIAALERIESFQGKIGPTIMHADFNILDLQFEQSLELRDVSISYSGDKEELKGLSMNIRKGEKVGIVGYSGAGKTSIVDLILRFYEPIRGTILLDGKNIAEISESAYRSIFGLVSQEPVLFHGTVEENIILDGKPDTTLLNKVLKMVNLDRQILDQSVGDRGAMLSGGQRQRVCIARALHRQPQILILDEPTSELDARNEREVSDAILKVVDSQTIIMISHNVSLLQQMDRILVIDKGTLIEEDNFESLIEGSLIFRSLLGIV